MTLISGHCLDSVFGTNAAGLRVQLRRCDTQGEVLVDVETGADGRFRTEVDVAGDDPVTTYELVYDTGDYLARDPIAELGRSIMPTSLVSLRFPDRSAHYHFSMAFTPGSFTVLAVVL